MAISGAIPAHGTILSVEILADVFSPIAEITEISNLRLSRRMIEVTPLNSDNNRIEKIGGEVDCSFDVVLNLIPIDGGLDSTDVGGHLNMNDATMVRWRLTFPGGGSQDEWTISGWLQGWDETGQRYEQLKATMHAEVSGKPTIA